jgi:hypothetical protein
MAKSIAGQIRQFVIGGDLLQQRFDSAHALGGDDNELHRKTANGIGQLGAIVK